MENISTGATPIAVPSRAEYMNSIIVNLRVEPNGVKVGYIPLELCTIPAFQRNDTKNIARIAEAWNDTKCGYITVNSHEDRFSVIDGSHRVRAARLCGKTHILAKVYQNLTLEEEAEVFVHQQDNVTKLTPYDKFNAALLAGDRPEGRSARKLKEVCERHNIIIKKNPIPTSTGCLRSLSQAWHLADTNPEILEWMFTLIDEAGWDAEPGALSESYIMAMNQMYVRHTVAGDLADARQKILGVISHISPRKFELESRAAYVDRGPGPAITAMLESVVRGAAVLSAT